MKGYLGNIEEETSVNDNFRKVLYTDERVQLVVMCLLPQEEIGEEVHTLDQFLRIEEGEGEVVMDGERASCSAGMAMVIPSHVRHNIINTSAHDALKLYTIYAPPNHPPGTVHRTKAEAEAAEH